MSTSKRRRLDMEGLPQSMSAFALRKKLLAQQSQVETAPIDQADLPRDTVPTNASKKATSPQKKTRKTKSAGNTPIEPEAISPPLNELLPPQGLVDVSHPRLVDEPATASSLSNSPLHEDDGPDDGPDDVCNPSQTIHLSTFQPSKSNFWKKRKGVSRLGLDEGERLVVLGSYGIRVETGEVTIYGAILQASQGVYWVHASQSHALPVIRCTKDATLELNPHPDAQGLKALGLLSPLFRKLWWERPNSSSPEKDSVFDETYRILYTPNDMPKKVILQDLKSPPEWNREIAKFVTPTGSVSSVMVAGPKSSGKSTFGRILTNRLLTGMPNRTSKSSSPGVVVLDLDPGQPEYCGAGQIALVLVAKPVLSPSFCRPLDTPGIRTIRSHGLASLSPASDPALYIEMALDLFAHYRNSYGSLPLIINTPGWIQGTGLDLLVSLIGELRPSEVVYMSQTGPVDVVEALEGICNATRFVTLPSQPGQASLRTAADLRAMQTMSYFHAEPTIRKAGGQNLDWFQRPLTAMVPWQVCFKGADRGIFGILFYDFQPQPDLVVDAINGAVLVAVEVESMKAFRDIGNHQLPPDSGGSLVTPEPMDLDIDTTGQAQSSSLSLVQETAIAMTADGMPFIDASHGLTLDPRYSRSLGLVLVRGVDVKGGDLHLLCPITVSQIEDVRARGGNIVLVSGKFDPPSWAYTEDLYYQSYGDGGDGNEGPELDSRPEDIQVDLEDMRGGNAGSFSTSTGSVPWIEVLTRNQKRGAGSKVWRVRRDLGRVGIPTD